MLPSLVQWWLLRRRRRHAAVEVAEVSGSAYCAAARAWPLGAVAVAIDGQVSVTMTRIFPGTFRRGASTVLQACVPAGPPSERDSLGELISPSDVIAAYVTVTIDGTAVAGFNRRAITLFLAEPSGSPDPRVPEWNAVYTLPAAAINRAGYVVVRFEVDLVGGAKAAWEVQGPAT